ncbi:hypothetical protein DL767_008246 [Monosporascus sp. MG133]|nr:hypothetical protein DL767_008246 [Monosporascus sp. MG133]
MEHCQMYIHIALRVTDWLCLNMTLLAPLCANIHSPFLMSYVRTLEVVYDDSAGAVDKEDINKGYGGQYVYLRPQYTSNRNEAACGFSLYTTYVEDLCANDISKGDGHDLYRYINVYHKLDNEGTRVIGSVYLREERMGDGQTDDLNKDRGGRDLYLCWKYAD